VRGVYVLGMHRSGTSLLAGVVDALGFHGGPPDTMLRPDQFNRDGYWEQRPIVELHDEVLLRLGGFASAPPEVTTLEPDLAREVSRRIDDTVAEFERPWFVKDPRQVLLLDAWDAAIGDQAFAVIASRRPHDVIRSLRHRNGYSAELAGGLWEHYTHAMLETSRGRRCYVVQYEDLLARRREIITDLVRVLSGLFSVDGPIRQPAIDAAIALVGCPGEASSSTATPPIPTSELLPEQVKLYEVIRELHGHQGALDVPRLPPISSAGRHAIEWRRRRLRTASYFVGRRLNVRAALDRRRLMSRATPTG
jgi:hypothetical protein